MPKMKSKSAVKKRFKLTASGKVKRYQCNASHLLTKKAPGRKRRLRKGTLVDPALAKRIRRFLVQ